MQFLDDVHTCQQVLFHGLQLLDAANAFVEYDYFAVQIGVTLFLVVYQTINVEVREQDNETGEDSRANGNNTEFLLFLLVKMLVVTFN